MGAGYAGGEGDNDVDGVVSEYWLDGWVAIFCLTGCEETTGTLVFLTTVATIIKTATIIPVTIKTVATINSGSSKISESNK